MKKTPVKKIPKRTLPKRPAPPIVVHLPDVTVHPVFQQPVAICLGRKTVYVFRDATEISNPAVAQKLFDVASSHERFDNVESNVRVKFVTRLYLTKFVLELDTLDANRRKAVESLLSQAIQEICRW